MWKKTLKFIIQFLTRHLGLVAILIVVFTFVVLFRMAYLSEKYNGDFQRYRLAKLDLKQERALARLEGKRPCRVLKLRKKFLKWRIEKLENTLEITNLKLKNTQEVLDKYSYE